MKDASPTDMARKKNGTEQRLMHAAEIEFAKHGFSGARVEQITKRAKANPRMLYHYFGGKSAIYIAVLEAAVSKLRIRELDDAIDAAAPIAGLMILFDLMGEHFENNPRLVRLLTNENIQQARSMRNSTRIKDLSAPVLAKISELLKRGAVHGSMRSDLDPLHIYVVMVALNQFHISNNHTISAIFDVDISADEWRKEHRRLSGDVLSSYLKSVSEN
jgi:AcrR family transcriptional regulator